MTTNLRIERTVIKTLALSLLSTSIGLTGTAAAKAASSPQGLQKIVAESETDSRSPKTVAARCPSGQVVVGGGAWAFASGPGPSRELLLTRAEPVPEGYIVTATEAAGGTDARWFLRATAICADADSLTAREIVSASTPLSSSSAQQAKAVCPGGTRVVGTGARVNNAGRQVGLQVTRAAGPGDIVRAQAHEDASGYADNWNVTSVAVCAEPPPGYDVVFGRSEAEGSEVEKLATAACPNGQRILDAGGAISFDAPGNVFLRMFRPLRDVVPEPGALIAAQAQAVENEETPEDWDFIVAEAICAD